VGHVGQTKIFVGSLTLSTFNNIFFAPTIALTHSGVRKGDALIVNGFALPGALVQVVVDGIIAPANTLAREDGFYTVNVSTGDLSLGKHAVQVRQTHGGRVSDFSLSSSFTLSNILRTEVDLNNDGVLNVRDVNIFLSAWISTNKDRRTAVDFNNDGILNLQDVSIFAQSL